MRLERLVERPIYRMWCGAHRLEVELENSFEGQPKKVPPIPGVPGQSEFTKIINSVAAAYGPMNHKKHAHFQAFESARREPHHNFLKIFPARWATTVFEAITRLAEKFDTLMAHLLNVYEDTAREWKKPQRENALALYEQLNDADFLILLHLQMDVLLPLSTQSLLYQKTHSTVIGEFNRQKLLGQRLKWLGEGRSDNLVKFLNEAKCTDKASVINAYLDDPESSLIESCGTIEKYESSLFRAFRGHRLYDRPNSPFKPMSEYLASYVERLLSNHQKYMIDKQQLLENFDELDQRLWTEAKMEDGKPLVALGEFFKIEDYEVIGILWFTMKYEIMTSMFYYEHKFDNPQEFWSSLLLSKEIRWNAPMKRLVEISLSLTTSNADAERVFSVLTHVKNKYRNRMSVKSTENALRININGPELSKLDIYSYSQMWVADNHWFTDYIVPHPHQSKQQKNKFFHDDNEAEDQVSYSESRLY